ncbi:primary-amine oxidase [Scopulibacillus darangshiensis]|uniref:Amine oxidase n=1 Tax=Scopulibacillus darangshiensis TaxID=442528 RepID=A0A4V2SML6_9BACL|nr:primary-amine oxidase [Scopulibacillus darangshiensis]TCP27786.1 primary-amine oxidase [Scopulibacillus darangshiensis]
METNEQVLQKVAHPLEPLTADEITKAVAILRKKKNISVNSRFAQVLLNEPEKDVVTSFKKGEPVEREAFIILLEPETSKTYEAVVSITKEDVMSWELIQDVRPGFILDEFDEVEQLVINDPDYQAALIKRGVTDPSLVMVDPWSSGYFNIKEDEGKRLIRALAWVRPSANENGYAFPLTGLIAVVDVNKMEILRIEDYGVKPLPPLDGAYTPETAKGYDIETRKDLKPLDIVQPEGPSFKVEGHSIEWQKWKIRFGYTPREGLVIHTVGYEDKGKVRPILYRASLSEMVVPYGDTNPAHNWQNAFDAGEYGMGQLANSLELGCDCVGDIRYFDATIANSKGEPLTIKNAICLHEEDYGVAWKHTDWRTNQVEVRRSRRFVISFFATVANYDYGFFWSFYPDGTIEQEVKLTGILNVGALDEGEVPKYGTMISPQVNAPHHQHFFNFRIDTQIDGMKNSVVEQHTVAEKPSLENPNNNAFYPVSRTFKTETESVRNIDLPSQRTWKIINPDSKNFVGQPVGYKLVTGENCLPFAGDDATLIQRAGFIKNHLHVTKFDRNQMYASGKYPNQHKGGDSLEHFVKGDRQIENEDVVIWYTMGHHHITRTEDWPVMPTAYQSFQLKPVGFFDRNPALDLPRPAHKKGSSCHN